MDWLCARPVWQNLPKYKQHHLGHHTQTGTALDPDWSLHKDFPTTRASMLRKGLRDLSGLTALKLLYGLTMMDAGVLRWTVANDIQRMPDAPGLAKGLLNFARNAWPMLVSNAVLAAILAACGQAWLYWSWLAAYVFFLPLFVRIRSIAEHGCLPRTRDVLANTRTTRAGLLARMTVAPVHVNFHIEHHLLASVPYYRLPALHQLLRQRQWVQEPPSYWQVLKLAASRPLQLTSSL